jgi:hypothetical protein
VLRRVDRERRADGDASHPARTSIDASSTAPVKIPASMKSDAGSRPARRQPPPTLVPPARLTLGGAVPIRRPARRRLQQRVHGLRSRTRPARWSDPGPALDEHPTTVATPSTPPGMVWSADASPAGVRPPHRDRLREGAADVDADADGRCGADEVVGRATRSPAPRPAARGAAST